ncbi:MAG: aminotransferase class IV [Flavobacteriaceae bacterium]
MKFCNVNGSLIDSDESFLSLNDLVSGYSIKVYELLICDHLEESVVEPFYFSLMASMRIYRIPIPVSYTLEFFIAETNKLLESNQVGLEEVAVNWTVFFKEGAPEFSMHLKKLPEEYSNPKSIGELDLFKDGFLGADYISGVPSENQAAFYVAKGYMNDHQLQDVLLINHKKEIVQTLNGYLFVRFGDVIKTPAESTGVTRLTLRNQFIKQLKDRGVSVEEVSITPFELQRADECFIYNPLKGVSSVSNYRKKIYETSFSDTIS